MFPLRSCLLKGSSAWPPAAFRVWLVAVVVGVMLAGCASEGVPEVPAAADGTRDEVLVTGRQIYVERCASCHGNNGSGGRGSKLSEGAMVRRYPDIAAQVAITAEGRRAMPPFKETLTEAEIEAVSRYTREVL